jgi:hypothetical protein
MQTANSAQQSGLLGGEEKPQPGQPPQAGHGPMTLAQVAQMANAQGQIIEQEQLMRKKRRQGLLSGEMV